MAKLGLALGVLSAIVFSVPDMGRTGTLMINSVTLAAEMASSNNDADRTKNPQSQPIAKLCPQTNGKVDVNEFHRLRDRLSARVSDKEELSRIDAVVVQAQHDCLLKRHTGAPILVSGLMEQLAGNWREQGNPGRADELYQEAYGILRDYTDAAMLKMPLLQDWASFKLAVGEPQRAIELAKLRTAEARKEYESGPSAKEVSSADLIGALKFEAWVLEWVGLADEAGTAKQEAERLSAQQKPCIGVCGLD